MTAKKFSTLFLGTILVLAIVSIALWNGVVSRTFHGPDGHGDLNRLGSVVYIPSDTPQYRPQQRHKEFRDYLQEGGTENFDVLTIGDSFSNGGGGAYYEDYLASEHSLKVLNVPQKNYDALTMYYILEHLGYIDKIQPKVVIIETVGRYAGQRYGKEMQAVPDFSKVDFDNMFLLGKDQSQAEEKDSQKFFPGLMMKANKKYLVNKAAALRSDYKLSTTTDYAAIESDLFSNATRTKTLFFYDEDFNYLRHPMNAEMVNKNMNDAASDMRKKGIQMVFMPCVDKFDLYYPYLNEKDKARWPENTVFEDLDKLPKEYTFVNTKMLLRPLLAENTKDVYWQDDTHWSWKAFQIVVDAMMQDLVIK